MEDYISASEINEFLYCQRSWWYKLHGAENAHQMIMAAGSAHHETFAKTVRRAQRLKLLAWRLLAAGLLLLVLFVLFKLAGA